MKRLIDVMGAFVAILLLSPLLLVISILVFWKMGAPVVFRQMRPGLHGIPFKMVKFRTMSTTTTSNGDLLPDRDRITLIGKFLRSTSLDELPSLWNVLKGDMSLVGPRPLLVEYLPLYSPQQQRRHEVRPGITGWAQVNGRNAISWEEKFELDVWYVEKHTLLLDFKIMLLTLKKVLKREGISAAKEATMPKFNGSMNEQQNNGK